MLLLLSINTLNTSITLMWIIVDIMWIKVDRRKHRELVEKLSLAQILILMFYIFGWLKFSFLYALCSSKIFYAFQSFLQNIYPREALKCDFSSSPSAKRSLLYILDQVCLLLVYGHMFMY